MNKFKVPANEIERRRVNIQQQLQAHGIDGLFIAQRVDLFYFSGTAQNGFLYLPSDGSPSLFIKRYLPRARSESPLENIIEIQSIREIPERLMDVYGELPQVLGLELDVIPVNDFNFYRDLFPVKGIVDASPLILNSRKIKSDWEIVQLEKTAEMTRKTFDYMKETIRPGLSEIEFAGMFETFARKLGHGAKLRSRNYQTETYPWHILSGENGGKVGVLDSPASGAGTSAAFPSGAGYRKLAPHEPIMIDLGSVLNGYHMDETRMFAMGSMPDKALDACRAVIDIHNSILERVKPGIAVSEVFEFSVNLADRLGYAEPYLGPPGYKVNFIGHGIGLEMIEPPIIARGKRDIFKSGMTFALEPKMNFKDEFSAGVESVFLVTEKGARLISKVAVDVFIC